MYLALSLPCSPFHMQTLSKDFGNILSLVKDSCLNNSLATKVTKQLTGERHLQVSQLTQAFSLLKCKHLMYSHLAFTLSLFLLKELFNTTDVFTLGLTRQTDKGNTSGVIALLSVVENIVRLIASQLQDNVTGVRTDNTGNVHWPHDKQYRTFLDASNCSHRSFTYTTKRFTHSLHTDTSHLATLV